MHFRFPCEVRVRSTPLIPCRRHGKKRKEDEPAAIEGETNAATPAPAAPTDTTAQAVTNVASATSVGSKKDTSGNSGTGTNSGSSSKSKSKSKNQQSSSATPSAAPPTTPSPRCQTPVTNNPSPAGSAFSTPPVSNNNNGNNNGGGNNHSNSAPNNGTTAAGGNTNQLMSSNSSLMNMATMIDTFTDAQLQSNQISSTVLDSPYSYDYQTGSYIDSRNYYGNWPPPPHPHNPHAATAAHNMTALGTAPPSGATATAPSNPNPNINPIAMTPNPAGHQTATQHTSGTQLEGNTYNTGCYNQLPTAGSHQLTQVHDVRGEVKSRGGSEENPDSTTLVNNSLATESKLTTLTPMAPMTNLTTQHHSHASPHPHASPLEEGFVKPKPPTDYSQYSQYPNNYQMYPPPHSAYSAYDAYQNMNYNYGYHQAYSPYGMYPQQTPPPTPPPPSPNWNMYSHHQGSSGATTAPYSSTPLPPSATGPIHQTAPSMNSAPMPPSQTVLPNTGSGAGSVKPINDGGLPPTPNTAPSICGGNVPALNATPQNTPMTDLNQTTGATNLTDDAIATNPNTGLTSPDISNTIANNSSSSATLTTAVANPNENTNSATTPSPVSAPNETSNPASTASSSNSNKIEPIGEISDFSENIEAFQDPQMGGVAIALNHGSVMIECAKHEMHSTTSLKNPNRHEPTRMTLIFYQHRNLNRHHHGIDEWEEKMRVKKINTDLDNKAKEEKEKIKKEHVGENDEEEEGDDERPPAAATPTNTTKANTSKKESGSGGNGSSNNQTAKSGNAPSGGKKKKESSKKNSQNNSSTDPKNEKVALRAPTLTTTSWTTLFPMHPCVVTGPYQEGNSSPTSTTVQQQQQQQQQMNEQPQPQPMQT